MTCIVAYVNPETGQAWMGGDAAASAGWNTRLITHPKVFRVRDMLIGYTSSFRMGQILQYHLEPALVERIPVVDDPYEYLVREFTRTVRELFKEHGYSKVENNKEEGGTFLVAFAGRLFQMNSDYSVMEYQDNYSAVGSGYHYALGALHTLWLDKTVAHNVPIALEMALGAAAYFCNGVSEPFSIMTMKPGGEDDE